MSKLYAQGQGQPGQGFPGGPGQGFPGGPGGPGQQAPPQEEPNVNDID